MPPIRHKQVPAKVTAYVDEGIKDLVEILNTFDKVWSSESCQGYENEMVDIVLHYGVLRDYDPIGTMNFVEKLARTIRQVAIERMGLICHSIWLSLEWAGDMNIPSIVIKCAQDDIEEVTKVFCYVRSEFG